MLPDSHYSPTLRFQKPVCLSVPLDIAAKLFSPPAPVVLRDRAVSGAGVPETPVDEDCDSVPHQCDVDRPAGPVDTAMKAVSKAASPKFLTQADLGSRVGPCLFGQPNSSRVVERGRTRGARNLRSHGLKLWALRRLAALRRGRTVPVTGAKYCRWCEGRVVVRRCGRDREGSFIKRGFRAFVLL